MGADLWIGIVARDHSHTPVEGLQIQVPHCYASKVEVIDVIFADGERGSCRIQREAVSVGCLPGAERRAEYA